MSYSNDVKMLLGIKDDFVSISNVDHIRMDGNKVTIVHRTLTIAKANHLLTIKK